MFKPDSPKLINDNFAYLFSSDSMPKPLYLDNYSKVNNQQESKPRELYFKSDPEKDKYLDPFTRYLKSVAKEGEIKIVPDDKIKRLQDENKDPVPIIEIGPSLTSLNWASNIENLENLENITNIENIENIEKLPINWQNYDNSPNAEIKYRISTRPMNQQLCGSCYACAVANCISDTFIFDPTIKLTTNPNISPMAILSCLNVNGCDGGDPFSVLNEISQKGVLSTYCLNYQSICGAKLVQPESEEKIKFSLDWQGNIKYTGKTPDYITPANFGSRNLGPQLDRTTDLGNNFYQKKEIKVKQTQRGISIGTSSGYGPIVGSCSNPNIPPCLCYSSTNNSDCGGNKFNRFFINPPRLLVKDLDPNAISKIKSHLITYGSVISGYFIYNNFQDNNDDFAQTNGVYIESESYGSLNPKGEIGAHAICIVGWGVEPGPIRLESNGIILTNIEYWLVRNSWGKTWGIDGYFKIALNKKIGNYEINPTTSLEKFNTIGNIKNLGGVIVFTPRKTTSYEGNCQIQPLRENRMYHRLEKLLNVSTNENEFTIIQQKRNQILKNIRQISKPENKLNEITQIIILIIIIIMVILILKLENKK